MASARRTGARARGLHLGSDFGYRALDLTGRAPELRSAQPQWIRDLVAGYVHGYNLAVREHDPSELPAWAAGAPWVRQIDELDLWAYLWDVTLMASGRNLVQLIGRAEAPGPDGPAAASPMSVMGPPPAASNGWAVGGAMSASGAGMVLANPHFPWYGEARFWECHLRIPGAYDVYGVSLLGCPGVQMGFNASLAWTHTFSRGHRFTVATLELDPQDPTRYRHGDEMREMVPAEHRVQVLGPDGSTRASTRTLWSSHHGPMLNLPLVGWGTTTGFTYRDANIDNTAVLEQFLRMGMAADVGELRSVFHEVRGLPWVNTLAADSRGDAWYTDASATPALSPEAQQRFTTRLDEDLVAALLYENRIALLDGSDPGDDWLDHPGARSPGIEPPGALPELTTRGVVLNANDSHWCNSPGQLLEGYSVMGGLERTPRSLRTRQNLRLAAELRDRGAVTRSDLLAAVLDNASLSSELLRDEVLAVLDETVASEGAVVAPEGHEVDLARVRRVLGEWDGTYGLQARGAALWREFMAGFEEKAWLDAGPLFAEPFDPDDPIGTPRGLAARQQDGAGPSAASPVLHAVAEAVRVLDEAGVALDAPLGEVQWADRGGVRISVHGGGEEDAQRAGALGRPAPGLDGRAPAAPEPVAGRERTGLRHGGYRVTYGASFLMAVELTPQGPVGEGVLAYGQSAHPGSPRHADGTEAYASGSLRPLRFTDAEIEASPVLERFVLGS
ncbi:MAG: penicillin acylase family protein [Microthrixaceae bacterium]